MGVWSVTVTGLRSTMLKSRTGDGSFADDWDGGACKVKKTFELLSTCSLLRRAFSAIKRVRVCDEWNGSYPELRFSA